MFPNYQGFSTPQVPTNCSFQESVGLNRKGSLKDFMIPNESRSPINPDDSPLLQVMRPAFIRGLSSTDFIDNKKSNDLHRSLFPESVPTSYTMNYMSNYIAEEAEQDLSPQLKSNINFTETQSNTETRNLLNNDEPRLVVRTKYRKRRATAEPASKEDLANQNI